MSEPIFLTLEEVISIHERCLAEHGGSAGTRDHGLVDSALASARNTYYYAQGDLFDIAATYAFHLAESQAFLDANKRTGVSTAMIFLARNGAYVHPDKWELYLAMIEIADKKLSKAGLANILRQSAERASKGQS